MNPFVSIAAFDAALSRTLRHPDRERLGSRLKRPMRNSSYKFLQRGSKERGISMK
jgi:hypothetical protein